MEEITKIDLWLISLIVTTLIVLVGWFGKQMHNQTMSKFDKLIDTVQDLNKQMAVHEEKFSNYSEEIKKINFQNVEQDKLIADLKERMHAAEGVVKTLEYHFKSGNIDFKFK